MNAKNYTLEGRVKELLNSFVVDLFDFFRFVDLSQIDMHELEVLLEKMVKEYNDRVHHVFDEFFIEFKNKLRG